MIYQEPDSIDKDTAERIFNSDDVSDICFAMVSAAFNIDDWKWLQDKFLGFLESNDADLSRLAATCLGHVARIHGQLDKELVRKALLSKQHLPQMCGTVEDALSDMDIFLKK